MTTSPRLSNNSSSRHNPTIGTSTSPNLSGAIQQGATGRTQRGKVTRTETRHHQHADAMPLRFVRSKVSGVDPLQLAISTTALAKDLLTTLQFPPAIAAVSVVLLILETVQVSPTLGAAVWFGPVGSESYSNPPTSVQNIQTNKAGCIALARRAAQILVDIDHQMRGRWDSAPQRLVQNLQKFEG